VLTRHHTRVSSLALTLRVIRLSLPASSQVQRPVILLPICRVWHRVPSQVEILPTTPHVCRQRTQLGDPAYFPARDPVKNLPCIRAWNQSPEKLSFPQLPPVCALVACPARHPTCDLRGVLVYARAILQATVRPQHRAIIPAEGQVIYQVTDHLMRHRINHRTDHRTCLRISLRISLRTGLRKALQTNPRAHQAIDPAKHQAILRLLLSVQCQAVYRAIDLLYPAFDQVGRHPTHLPMYQAIRRLLLPVLCHSIYQTINLLHPAFDQIGRPPIHLPSYTVNQRISKSLIFRPLHRCRGKIRKTTQPGT
jgi:hypothetical protein